MCLAAAAEIQSILAEKNELIAEVNGWREQYGVASIGSRQVKPVGDPILALLKVDQEVFGTFPGGFGDNATIEEHDDDQGLENSSRPQVEEPRVPIHSNFNPQAATHTISNTGLNFQEHTSMHPLPRAQSVPTDSNHFSERLIPNSHMQANRIAAQPTIIQPEDPFSFLDDGYGTPLASNANSLPPSSNFAELNMHQNIYHDFAMPLPEVGYYLTPANDKLNMGYMP